MKLLKQQVGIFFSFFLNKFISLFADDTENLESQADDIEEDFFSSDAGESTEDEDRFTSDVEWNKFVLFFFFSIIIVANKYGHCFNIIIQEF